MRHIPIAEFKDKVSEIVAAAEAGEEIVITRHGKAAAKLMPVLAESERIERRRTALAEMAELRDEMRGRGVSVTREEILAWKSEGQR